MARAAAPLRGQQLLQRIRQRGPERVYLLHGREGWFVDRAVGLLKQAVFGGPGGEASRSVNYDVFSGREARVEPLATACRTLPMFAS